jgi:hypothetical protein
VTSAHIIQLISDSTISNRNIVSPLNEIQNIKEFDSNLNVINSKNNKKTTKDDQSKNEKNNFEQTYQDSN